MKKGQALLLLLTTILLLFLQLSSGSVSIPLVGIWETLTLQPGVEETHRIILWDSRIPRTMTAALAGAALSWSGMLMQTLFRNPLAGPSMLGISSGASLGVALLVLGTGGTVHLAGLSGSVSIASAAFFGAFGLLSIVLLVSHRFANESTLLIFGIMLTYFTSAMVDALQSRAGSEALKSYISWGMGNFGDCNYSELTILLLALFLSIAITIYILPRLNLLTLGDHYAQTMGVDIKRTRVLIMIATGFMAGCATAFCGPISFIGLAVPHMSRWLTHTGDHRKNLPTTLWLGACIALACDWMSRMSALPLNTIASALGAPFVIVLVLKWKRFSSMI
jgi:iron complex transport system permease protein